MFVTAPTHSSASQVSGSTIHSAFLLYDKSSTKPSWEKHSIMQLKLKKLMLSITDEISIVIFKQYQQMNEIMCIVKGTCDGNWGDMCFVSGWSVPANTNRSISNIHLTTHSPHSWWLCTKWMGRHEVAWTYRNYEAKRCTFCTKSELNPTSSTRRKIRGR